MRLAGLARLNAAPVRLVKAANKDVLLIERFDRKKTAKDGHEQHWNAVCVEAQLSETDKKLF